MAMNLRLRPEAQAALRAEAERSQRSQQDVLRAAVDRYLGLDSPGRDVEDDLLATGKIKPARTPYRKVVPSEGSATRTPSLVLLDRDDRF